MPRIGTSFSIACSAAESPNSADALAASGLTSFIWPRIAPTISTSDMPPISSQIWRQVQPFSRLMSSSFSVSWSRVIACTPDAMKPKWKDQAARAAGCPRSRWTTGGLRWSYPGGGVSRRITLRLTRKSIRWLRMA